MFCKPTLAFLVLVTLAACGSKNPTDKLPGNSSSSSGSSSNSSSSSSSSSSSNSSSSSSSSSSSGGTITATCDATQFEQPAEVQLQRLVADGVFAQPTGLTFLPGNDNIMFVLQQNGVIFRLDRTGGELLVEEFIDLRDYYNVVYIPEGPGGCHECGLYSMAFHPDFSENGFIYLSFTEDGDPGTTMQSYVVRLRSEDNGRTLERDENGFPWREDIYHVEQPTRIHNNGQVKFGPDDYLYVSFGDGGPGDDPNNNSQNVDNPFGSILRLKDDGTPAPGNLVPGGLPEIYANGLRNPWHWTFDRLTGKLWLGDVGQARMEEVNIIENGGNYGWACFEGRRRANDCASDGPFVEPVWDYSHEEGQSVTGGYVYRGKSLQELYGAYIFGDFGSGVIWALLEDDGAYHRIKLLSSGKYISAFAEDSEGEIYIIDYASGGIHRIVAAEANPQLIPLPEELSATGCMSATDVTQPAQKLIPYDLIEAFWSDNALKERFIALPDGAQMHVEHDGDFTFPVGSILVKNFSLDGRLIETRLLLNQEDTGWSGFSYEWNESQTEAFLLESAKDVTIADQVWHFPSGAECSQCHTPAAGFVLGPEARQLNMDYTYGNGQTVNQLEYLADKRLFSNSFDPSQLGLALIDSQDGAATLEHRARSYLHSNCSQCHRPGGTSQAGLDFTIDAGLPFMNACGIEPIQGDLGIAGAKLIVPGDHAQSLVWQRLAHDEDYRMPPLASNVVDRAGADLVGDWIDSITECATIVGPEGADFVVSNKHSQAVLVKDGRSLALSQETADHSWVVEVWEGFYRLQNAQQPGQFIHAEKLPPSVSAIQNGWWSAQWSLERVGEYFRISNRWRGGYLSLDESTGELHLGAMPANPDAALWSFEVAQ